MKEQTTENLLRLREEVGKIADHNEQQMIDNKKLTGEQAIELFAKQNKTLATINWINNIIQLRFPPKVEGISNGQAKILGINK